MLHDTPLRKRHEDWRAALGAAERPAARAHRPGAAVGGPPSDSGGARPGEGRVAWLPYGPLDEAGRPRCEVVADYGAVEAEYAAVRRWAALLDGPHRATLRVTGGQRVEFLERMLTQQVKGIGGAGQSACRESFWLNRKGRIEADLLLVETGTALLIDVDVHQAAATAASLAEFIFAEEVAIVDDSPRTHRLALHGPRALAALGRAAGAGEWTLADRAVAALVVAGADVTVARRDLVGEIGLELFIPRDAAELVWDALVAAGADGRADARPIGWHAWNVARIEAGAPLFNVDFDSTCLPHESGVLRERVSFVKGCYLGQEIVARMESLGRPKRVLVGLRVEAALKGGMAGGTTGGARSDDAVLPEAGSNVHVLEGDDGSIVGEPVGQVTSSTVSPMLGAAPIAFAMVRSGHVTPGTRLAVAADGRLATARVGPLRFWPPVPVEAAAP